MAVIVISILWSCPVLVLAGIKQVEGVVHTINVTGWSCYPTSGKYPTIEGVYYSLFFFLVAANIFIVTLLYIPIGIQIYKHTRKTQTANANIASAPSDSTSESKPVDGPSLVAFTRKQAYRASQINFNMIFMTIMMFYLISYVPTCIFILIGKLSDHDFWYNLSTEEMNIYFTLDRFYVINHVVNPIIYCYFDFKFRKDFISLFRCS